MDKSEQVIAHVITNNDSFGGAQRNTLLTLKGLARDGYQVDLVCGPGRRLIEQAKEIGVRVYVIPDLVREVDLSKDRRAFIALHNLFRFRKYDIVHTHSTKAGLLGRVAAWLAKVPIIVHTVHGVPFELDDHLKSKLYVALERLVGNLTDRIVCVGKDLCREMAKWRIAPQARLTTIYSGIDFSAYVPKRTPEAVKREINVDGRWPIVGCIGRLCHQKAQHDLIKSISLLKEKYPSTMLILVGEGELRPQLEKTIQALGLSSNVTLLGHRDDIADIMNILHVYAMSSRWEGIGRALTEAMHSGLPIVATAVNGVKEIILHEETGLLVPPREPGRIAEAIDRLASDTELAARLSRNARQKAKEVMDGEKMIEAIEELYLDLGWSKHWRQSNSATSNTAS